MARHPRRSFVKRTVTAPQEMPSGRQSASTTCRMTASGSTRRWASSCQSFQALCACRNATTWNMLSPPDSSTCSPILLSKAHDCHW